MPRYSDDLINEVFAENDIVDYVSQYVKLKRSGKDYSGLCPFHGEKTPSFHVSQDKQLFHCFGCGASGNLVQFVMRMEGLDFVEALKVLADRVGIILPEDNGIADNLIHEKKQRIYGMNKFSARFFYNNMMKNEKGRVALRYFNDRKITPKTLTAYGLGYALDEKTSLLDALRSEGYKEEEILEAGLIIERDGGYMDKFRNRVMFPIIDLRGNVIGFGGRIMGDAKVINGFKIPKYLNSPETLVFNKGKNLFSLNLAKKEEEGKIILCEGYMDVISVYQAGVRNICATLGTAITPEQAKLLLRYCSEILLCYDSDEAGEKATIRAIEVINSVGGKARIIRLKGAKDPDEYIKKNGISMFRQAVKDAVPSTEYRISGVKSQYNIDTAEGKIEFVTKAADTLLSIQNDVEVDAYIKKMSEETGISKEAIYSEYKKKKSQKKQFDATPQMKRPPNLSKDTQNQGEVIYPTKTEALLLNLMTKDKKYVENVKKRVTVEDFSAKVSKRLFEIILDITETGKTPEPSVILTEFDGPDAQAVGAVFYNNEVYADDEKAIDDLILDMRRTKINAEMERTTDPIRLKELIENLRTLGRN